MSEPESPFLEAAVGNPGGWSEERLALIPTYKQQILELLASGFFVSEIATQLNITVRTIRQWRASDKVFAEDFADAESAFTDQIEREAIRRAKDGVLEPVINNGKVVFDASGEPMMTRKYSDGLIQFVLRGKRREVYGDKREVDQKTTIDLAGSRNEIARKFEAVARSTEGGES